MTDEKVLASNERGNKKIGLNHILLIALYVCVFLAFLSDSLWVFLGPVMAVLCVYLYFTGFPELITALIIVANDAMGTVFRGSISFPYLLLAMALLRFVLYKRKIKISEILFFAVALVLLGELWMVDLIEIRSVIYSMSFIMGFLALSRDDDWSQCFSRGIIIAVALISLHALITGGIEFTELKAMGSNQIIVRYGVLGVGIGDPNFSSFLINIGLACTLGDKKMHWFIKALLSVLFFSTLAITVSVSGVIAAMVILVLFIMLRSRLRKGLLILCIALIALILAFGIYFELPTEMRNSALDGYLARIEGALSMLSAGDLSGATSNRSSIFEHYFTYITTQPLLGFLFGGNPLKIEGHDMPHNTYVGFLLQVGFIATVGLIFWIVWQIRANLKKPREDLCRMRNLLLKALCLMMAFTLSFYEGSLWALWMYFVFLL